MGARVDLGHELGHFGEVYKSNTKTAKKGDPKQTKRLLSGATPTPQNAIGIVACLHPAAIMYTGFSKKAQFQAAVQRAALVANGYKVPSLLELAGGEDAVTYPSEWIDPTPDMEVDLVFDIENTREGITWFGDYWDDRAPIERLWRTTPPMTAGSSLPWQELKSEDLVWDNEEKVWHVP
jgi:hypothetical protein